MAGGSLIGKIHKAFSELTTVGLVDERRHCKIYGAQATGCNPITDAVKNGRETHKPVRKPNTIAKSLAIGDPADGYFAAKVIRETGGWARGRQRRRDRRGDAAARAARKASSPRRPAA